MAKQATAVSKPKISNSARKSQAMQFGERLSEDGQFDKDLEKLVKDKRNVARGPVTFLLDLCAESPFGKDDPLGDNWEGSFTNDELAGMPEPDSGTNEKPAIGNAMPDKYDDIRGGKTVKCSYYRDMLDGTELAKRIDVQLRMIEDKSHPCFADGVSRVAAEKAKLTKTLSTGLTNLKNAVRLHRQIRRIVEDYPTVSIKFILARIKDDAGKVIGYELADVEACFEIQDRLNPSQTLSYTPNQVLRLNVDAAIAAGGEPAHLMKQGNGTQDDEEEGTMAPVIQKFDQFKDYILELSVYVARPDFQKQALAWKAGAVKSDTDTLERLIDLSERIDAIISPSDLAWYSEIKARRAAEAQEEANQNKIMRKAS